MNKMFRRSEKDEDLALPPGDPLTEIYKRGRQEWDERVGDAVARERTWKRMFALCFLGATVSVAGNIYQGTQSKVVPFVVVRDSLGDVVAVRSVERAENPDQAQVAADLKRWIRNVRTVYTDVKALRAFILDAYAMTAKRSAANQALGEYYRAVDPFERARKETAAVSNQSALPISDGDNEGRRTWRLEWTEIVSARDGTVISHEQWQATVTFVVTPPRSAAEVQSNPAGIYVVNYSWTKRNT
jgi:type IV secretory pathway TrbF-like protein